MNLGEKIKYLISTFEEDKTLKVYFTSSDDNYEKVQEYIWDTHMAIDILRSSLETFEKYGECAGSDPKGYWIRNIDYELI